MQVLKERNNNRAAVRQYGSAAVRQCSSTDGSKGQRSAAVGTVVLPSTSGRPVFEKQKKRFISHRTKKTPTYGTAHPPTTDDAVHSPPTHRPNLYYMQQYSCAAVRTAVHLVRGEQLRVVGWFLRTLYETGNRRGEFHFLTILDHLGERASRHPPPTHHPPPTIHPPFTHGPNQYSSTAMQQYVEQYT